jgi:CheY-like chemotaxis protein
MPELDGFEVIRRLRQIPCCQKTVLIAVSASAFESDRQRSLELGCNDFIAKPVKFDFLLERLRIHLNLTWIYESTPEITTKKKSTFEVPVVQLTTLQAADLLELSKKGDVQGIVEYAEELEKMDENLILFANHISQLAKGFRLREIRKIAQQHIH